MNVFPKRQMVTQDYGAVRILLLQYKLLHTKSLLQSPVVDSFHKTESKVLVGLSLFDSLHFIISCRILSSALGPSILKNAYNQ